jgi:hypothetical protein
MQHFRVGVDFCKRVAKKKLWRDDRLPYFIKLRFKEPHRFPQGVVHIQA